MQYILNYKQLTKCIFLTGALKDGFIIKDDPHCNLSSKEI